MEKKTQEFDTLLSDSRHHVSELVSVFIIKVVRMYYKLDEDYNKSKSRKTDVVLGRQMAMYLVRKHTNMSLSRIGSFFNKDHATVLHSVKVIDNYMFYHKERKQEVWELNRIIKFKSAAINEDLNWKNEYYYIDLDEFSSLRMGTTDQAILMKGFTNEEVEEFSKIFKHLKSVRHHNKTGMYILERLNKLNDEENGEKREKTEGETT